MFSQILFRLFNFAKRSRYSEIYVLAEMSSSISMNKEPFPLVEKIEKSEIWLTEEFT